MTQGAELLHAGFVQLLLSRILTRKTPFRYDLHMIRLRYAAALILLVISVLLTSGASATVTSILHEGAVPSCCDADRDGSESPLDAPCSGPDCQCISCLYFVMTLQSCQPAYDGWHDTLSYNTLVKTPPLEYFKAIDYPPEFS